MSSSNASVTKITKKPKGSNGSMVYSLGMGGDTAKKTRMAKKSLRRTAIKNSSHIKGKRVGLVAKTKRTQVAGKKKKESSQAREIMQLKQQLAAAEEKLKKKRANEKTLVHMVGELESENAELVKAQHSKGSNSGQLLADAKQYIAELQTRLVDAMCARDEYEDVRLDDQNQIFELQTQLRDALCARYESEKLRVNDQNDISELKRQLADALTTIEELKADIKTKDEKLEKSQVTIHKYEGEIEQLSEQKSNDSTTGSRKFFRYANDRHRQPIGINYVMDNESLEYADGYDYGNESPTEF